ncbi:hypothetical protein SAMN05421805_12527 [Saccharopolyspora antimicrobica]|uniref:Uncharacterized protein n=1 Tax=Saccharopolyspora antimicrobica TaxID=455193 RepID=A0A1I5K2Q4_9PSEU|nr:hypothetical protein [Saccharopolyspora antimicrobica]SFO79364.1 hypothetical protein SAMN05421805_12527 [Saccharopolyspora antimicrobica]
MAAPLINQDSAVLQQKTQAFTGHIGQMSTIATTVQGFEAELRAAYTGPETEIFGRKIQEWVENYRIVQTEFDRVVQALGTTQKNTQNQSDHNSVTAGGLDVSSYNGLQG